MNLVYDLFTFIYGLAFFLKILLIRLVIGTMAILANQGVAQTLKINLRGSNALVTA